MHRDVIEMELTHEERTLLLRYGYPFDRIRAALEACQASMRIETVPLDAFELNQLMALPFLSVVPAEFGLDAAGQGMQVADRAAYHAANAIHVQHQPTPQALGALQAIAAAGDHPRLGV